MNLAESISYISAELEKLTEAFPDHYVSNNLKVISLDKVLSIIRGAFDDTDFLDDEAVAKDIRDFRLFERADDPYLHRVAVVTLLSKVGYFILIKDDGSLTVCTADFLKSELSVHLRLENFDHED